MEINEASATSICNKFMQFKDWQVIDYINLSRIGLNPLIIKKIDDNKLLLFDNYTSLLNDIKNIIIKDLQANEGWSESFYLDIDDINTLKLFEYVNIGNDVERVIDDLKDITK